MDRWSPSFSTDSLKGITSPVWIHFPGLPLSCWDQENIPIIASMIGNPLMLDGNSFKWGKREYARCCVRVDLKRKLPTGVWIEGIHEISFQRVEYEKLTSLRYQCGRVGHSKDKCPDSIVVTETDLEYKGSKDVVNQGNAAEAKEVCITEKTSVQAESAKKNQDVAVQVQEIPITVNKFHVLDCYVEEGQIAEKMNEKISSNSNDLDLDEAVGSLELLDSNVEQIREEHSVGLSNSVKGNLDM
ncbi:uncharacterized protein LOC110113832 [Dendrobium catenatum]|uniref:uncharacterized protein LOC110113832 n=1 Tax=Dendrobium catenatum TaxID=906689 RepID=UPI0009F6E60A|nr:uncharacterized protein LOC110113832 [Dendrobium catenatum]